MKTHKVEQGSEEWFALRSGKLTGSMASRVGNNRTESHILEAVASKLSSGERRDFTSIDMERGNELEPQARALYELQTDCEVEEVGFVEMNEYIGCSPDGLVGKDGGIEIKCPKDEVYVKLLIDEKVDSKYMWQIQMCMLVCERKWWDYVAFNPNFKQSLFITRVLPDETMQEKLKDGFKVGAEKIKEYLSKIS